MIFYDVIKSTAGTGAAALLIAAVRDRGAFHDSVIWAPKGPSLAPGWCRTATVKGANAVLMMRFDLSEIGQTMRSSRMAPPR